MKKRLLAFILLMLVIPVVTCAAACALTLTVDETRLDSAFWGGVYHIYYVGSVSEDDGVTLVSPFSKIREDMDLTDIDTVGALEAFTDDLMKYISEASYTAAEANDEGQATFTAPRAGLYLVVGQTSEIDDGTKKTFVDRSPSLVALPGWITVGGKPVYANDRVIYPKVDTREETSIQISVIKTWSSNVPVSQRPRSIIIGLYRNDGTQVDTIRLNAENRWQHTFTDLNPAYSYYVRELYTERFKVSYKWLTDSLIEVHNQDYPPHDHLTQSGQLRWPIYVLVSIGLVLFAAGWLIRRNAEKKPRVTLVLMAAGIVLLACALGLTAYNAAEDAAAGEASAQAAQALAVQIEAGLHNEQNAQGENASSAQEITEPSAETTVLGLGDSDDLGGKNGLDALEALGNAEAFAADDVPLFMLSNTVNLPTAAVDGIDCVGILDIPDIGLSLPVAAETQYSTLKKMPCVYEGTPYAGNLVINGHNYARHFGKLKDLPVGTAAIFTDMDGNVFTYRLAWMEVLAPTDVEKMLADDGWDMTLYTCTIGGKSRVTVRFEQTAVTAAK